MGAVAPSADFMKDVVQPSPKGFHLVGFSQPACTSAESATAMFGLVQSVAFMATSLAGGSLAER